LVCKKKGGELKRKKIYTTTTKGKDYIYIFSMMYGVLIAIVV